jgi:tetratricopeptide (TPR) repeat protein
MEKEKCTTNVKSIIYYNHGNKKFRLGDNLGAITHYTYAINYNPNLAEAYNNRGTAKAKLGNLASAIEDYNVAIKINPNLMAAYSNRSRARLESGDQQGAARDYHMILNPKFYSQLNNRHLLESLVSNSSR